METEERNLAVPPSGQDHGGSVRQLAVQGELSIFSVGQWRESLLTALGPEGLEVNLAELEELDTAGVQLLLALARTARREAWPLRIRGDAGQLREKLKFLGLATHFQGVLDEVEAQVVQPGEGEL